MTLYRAIPKPKGMFVIEHRVNRFAPFYKIGEAISYSGVVSFKGENYHSIKELLRKLEEKTS